MGYNSVADNVGLSSLL